MPKNDKRDAVLVVGFLGATALLLWGAGKLLLGAQVPPPGSHVTVPNAALRLAPGSPGTNPQKVLDEVLARTDPQTTVEVTGAQGDVVTGVLAGLNVTFPASAIVRRS